MNTRMTQNVRWPAYLSGIASIVALVSLILFFWLESPPASVDVSQSSHFWGPVSDISPIIQMVFLLIVARALYSMQRSSAPRLSIIGLAIGILGMLGVVLLQLLLIFKIIPFEQEVGLVVSATGIIGVWMICVSTLGRRQHTLPARLGWLGLAVGIAFALEPVIFSALGGGAGWRNVMSNYLLLAVSALVFIVSYVGFPIWAFWFGCVFSTTNAPVENAVTTQPQ